MTVTITTVQSIGPLRDESAGKDQMTAVLLDFGFPFLLSSGHQKIPVAPIIDSKVKIQREGLLLGVEVQLLLLFPAVKGKCICYSATSRSLAVCGQWLSLEPAQYAFLYTSQL